MSQRRCCNRGECCCRIGDVMLKGMNIARGVKREAGRRIRKVLAENPQLGEDLKGAARAVIDAQIQGLTAFGRLTRVGTEVGIRVLRETRGSVDSWAEKTE